MTNYERGYYDALFSLRSYLYATISDAPMTDTERSVLRGIADVVNDRMAERVAPK